jgi:hypothetical protein
VGLAGRIVLGLIELELAVPVPIETKDVTAKIPTRAIFLSMVIPLVDVRRIGCCLAPMDFRAADD